jgi:tripartite-type tricarboxylate transporter receptor subunit TctC
MTGMLLPAGTPRTMVDKWYKETTQIMALPDVKERIGEMSFNIIVNSPREFTVQIKDEIARGESGGNPGELKWLS